MVTARIKAESEEQAKEIFIKEVASGGYTLQQEPNVAFAVKEVRVLESFTRQSKNGEVISVNVDALPSDFTYFLFRED